MDGLLATSWLVTCSDTQAQLPHPGRGIELAEDEQGDSGRRSAC